MTKGKITMGVNGRASKSNNETMLAVRTSQDLKEIFIDVCKQQDTTAAQEIRKFMREYVKRNGQKELPL